MSKKSNEPMIKVGKLKTLPEMEKFFEKLYGGVFKEQYGRLWTDDGEYSYTIDTSTREGRKVMAKTCFLLRQAGYEVNFGGVPRKLFQQKDNEEEK